MPDEEFNVCTPKEWILQTQDRPEDEPHHLNQVKVPAKIVEAEDLQFHVNSAVVLPDHKDSTEAADGASEDRITALAVFKVCLEEAEQNPDKTIAVVGHTDASGEEEFNLYLSDLRAKATHAVLKDDSATFAAMCEERSKVEDIQRILKWACAERGWECDPGEVDDKTGPKTRTAIRAFQTAYNEELEKSIDVDGIVGKQTWGAVFDLYSAALANMMEITPEELEAKRKALIFLDPPDIPELTRRLTERMTESPEALKLRIATAKREMEEGSKFDHRVVNHNGRLDDAVAEIKRIISEAESQPSERSGNLSTGE